MLCFAVVISHVVISQVLFLYMKVTFLNTCVIKKLKLYNEIHLNLVLAIILFFNIFCTSKLLLQIKYYFAVTDSYLK